MSAVVVSEHFLIERDPLKRRVFLRRTDSKFAIADVDAVFAALGAALSDVEGWSLLLDLRRAPARTEDNFEAATSPHLGPLLARFSRRAVLVRSAVGVLQVSRVGKKIGAGDVPGVFKDDEAAAIAFLDADAPPR